MTVRRIVPRVDLISPTGSTVVTLRPTDASWTWDEGTSPLIVGSVTVAMPTDAQYAMLRPGAGYYLMIGAETQPLSADSIYWLLRITDRTRTALGLVELQVASAELDLQSYTPSAVDRSNWANQGNIGNIIVNVLDKVWGSNGWTSPRISGAFGAADLLNLPVGYPTFQAMTNLFANPAVTSLTGFAPYSSAGSASTAVTLAQVAATGSQIAYGNGARTIARQSLTYMDVRYTQGGTPTTPVPASPGVTYTAFVQPRASTSQSLAGTLYIQFLSSDGSVIQTFSTALGSLGNTYQSNARAKLTATAPSGTTGMQIILRASGAIQSGAVLDGAQWLVVEGDGIDTDGATLVSYWDGDTADGTGGYNYDWTGAAGASASMRTPVIDRDPDSLTWSPGQSAWDFLLPILQSIDVRMFSFGYQPDSGVMKPRVNISYNEWGMNATQRVMQGVNLMDVSQVDSFSAEFGDGTPMYADQVIIHYTWTDSQGIARDAYDVYPSTGKKPYFLELTDTPYAGKGRAQGIWKRISARGTIVQGTADFIFQLFGGLQIAVTADAVGGSVVGYVEAVTQNPLRGTTEFRTKKTIAYTSASWFAATGSWASQTGSWAADS